MINTFIHNGLALVSGSVLKQLGLAQPEIFCFFCTKVENMLAEGEE